MEITRQVHARRAEHLAAGGRQRAPVRDEHLARVDETQPGNDPHAVAGRESGVAAHAHEGTQAIRVERRHRQVEGCGAAIGRALQREMLVLHARPRRHHDHTEPHGMARLERSGHLVSVTLGGGDRADHRDGTDRLQVAVDLSERAVDHKGRDARCRRAPPAACPWWR